MYQLKHSAMQALSCIWHTATPFSTFYNENYESYTNFLKETITYFGDMKSAQQPRDTTKEILGEALSQPHHLKKFEEQHLSIRLL